MTYVFHWRVLRVEERFEKKHISGIKENAIFEEISTGWYVTFTNHITIFLGYSKPSIEFGQLRKITLE